MPEYVLVAPRRKTFWELLDFWWRNYPFSVWYPYVPDEIPNNLNVNDDLKSLLGETVMNSVLNGEVALKARVSKENPNICYFGVFENAGTAEPLMVYPVTIGSEE